jgi:hypothetical protein
MSVKPKRDLIIEGKFQIFFISLFLERFTEIERENRILLEKMTIIMSNKNKGANSSISIYYILKPHLALYSSNLN